VEGSVRKGADRIRITAQLIDAASGNHIWAEKYERELKDVFALQDEIAQQIASNLIAENYEMELTRVRGMPTDNLTAYDLYWRGIDHSYLFTEESIGKAKEYFEAALNLDEMYAEAYAWLSRAYFMDYVCGWDRSPQVLERVVELARKAIAIDSSSSVAHRTQAGAMMHQGKTEQAMVEIERAISLDPNHADNYQQMGGLLGVQGKREESIEFLQKSMRLDPHHRAPIAANLGWAYRAVCRYEDAVKEYQKAILRDPDLLEGYTGLAKTYLQQYQTQQNEDPFVLDRAIEIAEKGVALDENAIGSHSALRHIYLWRRQYDQAVLEAEKVIAIAPKAPNGYTWLSHILGYLGRYEKAIELAEKAGQIDPTYSWPLSHAYRLTGRHEEAVAVVEKRFTSTLNYSELYHNRIELAILYSELGREEDAKAEAAKILELVPNFSVDVYGERIPYKDPAQAERDMAALRKAGLK